MRQEINEAGNKLLDLNVVDIKRYLKNRYPILMIDRVDEIVEGKSARGFKNFTYNEWFFPGHFEDNPNVPGIVTLEVLIEMFIMSFITLPECIGKETTDSKVDKLHFMRKIVPGDKLDVISELKMFRRGVAVGTSVGYVNGENACSCELVVCVPEIIDKFRPINNTGKSAVKESGL
jgi:3-hydroxyacyl-[acyl-carrier-protein] dehydratase